MNDVENYIAKFSNEVQQILQQIRTIILHSAPDAIEKMAYGMPGYKLNGKPLVYFGAYPYHIGLYATPAAHEAFTNELSAYKQGKGSVQFPLNKPIPFEVIEKIIQFKINQNLSLVR